MNTDWFTSLHSNLQLAEILANYSRDVTGVPITVTAKTGRCTLVRHLESLDSKVGSMTRQERESLGFA